MNVQQHERIARIKQLSRYLYICLTGIHYLMWVCWPVAVVVILVNEGPITLGAALIDTANQLQRILVTICISVIFFLLLKVVYHFRGLIRHFAAGDIFNKKAIDQARKALLYGLIFYGWSLGMLLVGWTYNLVKNTPALVSANSNFIWVLIFFGLMYVLLWALEIGCDLNEESELTI